MKENTLVGHQRTHTQTHAHYTRYITYILFIQEGYKIIAQSLIDCSVQTADKFNFPTQFFIIARPPTPLPALRYCVLHDDDDDAHNHKFTLEIFERRWNYIMSRYRRGKKKMYRKAWYHIRVKTSGSCEGISSNFQIREYMRYADVGNLIIEAEIFF